MFHSNPGFVYFVQAENGLIKIGFTTEHPLKRMASLRGSSPLRLSLMGVIVSSRSFEGYMHDRFAKYHSHAEWFHPGERLLYLIRRWAKEPVRVQSYMTHVFLWPLSWEGTGDERREYYAYHNNGAVLPKWSPVEEMAAAH